MTAEARSLPRCGAVTLSTRKHVVVSGANIFPKQVAEMREKASWKRDSDWERLCPRFLPPGFVTELLEGEDCVRVVCESLRFSIREPMLS